MNIVEQKRRIIELTLISFIFLFSSGCIMTPDDYDASGDDGTYTGSMTVYGGPGTDPDFKARTCPNVSASLVIANGVATLTTNDTYPSYGHAPGVVTNHVASGSVFANNKFELEVGWTIEETDVQLVDLMTLKVCEATPPTTPGDANTGGRGLLQDLAFIVGEPGFVGEFGNGVARGSLWYGVRCTDGRFLPLCLYFMQLNKQ